MRDPLAACVKAGHTFSDLIRSLMERDDRTYEQFLTAINDLHTRLDDMESRIDEQIRKRKNAGTGVTG
jgi:predicted CopG family antitoxin